MKKYFFLILIFVLVSCVSNAPQQVGPGPEGEEIPVITASANQKIVKALNTWDDPQLALDLYSEAIDLAPVNPLTYFLRAELYNKLGDIKAALKDLDQAIELDPGFAVAYKYRGAIRLWDKGDERGREDLKMAYKLAPGDIDIALTYVYEVVYHEGGNPLPVFENLMALYPDNPEVYKVLGSWYRKQENYEQSRAYLQQAIALAPEESYYYNELGFTLEAMGDLEEALETFNQALTLYPEDHDALAHKAKILIGFRDYAQAREVLDRLLAGKWYDEQMVLFSSLLYFEAGQLEKALKELDNYPNQYDGSYLMYQAVFQALQGNEELGFKTLNRYIESESWDPRGFLARGVLYLYLDNQEEADYNFRRFFEIFEDKFGSDKFFYQYYQDLFYLVRGLEGSFPALYQSLPQELKDILQ